MRIVDCILLLSAHSIKSIQEKTIVVSTHKSNQFYSFTVLLDLQVLHVLQALQNIFSKILDIQLFILYTNYKIQK
jgi:hypothetical protein